MLIEDLSVGGLSSFLVAKNASVLKSLHGFPLSCTLALNVSIMISEGQAVLSTRSTNQQTISRLMHP